MVVKDLVIFGEKFKMTIRGQGKLPQEIECKISDVE